MFVNPDSAKRTTPSVTSSNLKDTGITTYQTALLGLIAVVAVGAMYFQSIETSQSGEFTAYALSEGDEFTLLEERERVKNHFTTELEGIIPLNFGTHELLEERSVGKIHFTTNIDNVQPIRVNDFSLLEERVNERNHFLYGLV